MKKIKCDCCLGKWIVENEDLEKLTVCPYCGISIQGELEFKDYDTLDKAIYGAIAKMGKTVLSNPRQLSGFMMDIAPGLSKEIRIFSKTVTKDYITYIKNAFDEDVDVAENSINRLYHLFVEEEGLSDNWADMLCTGLYGAILYSKGIGTTRNINVEISDYAITTSEKADIRDNRRNVENSTNSNKTTDACRSLLENAARYRSSNRIDDALEQYRQAANYGYVPAYNLIAEIYYLKKNMKKAWKWYLKAAEANDSIGQYYVGYFYQEGIHVKKDVLLAVKYYEKSANQGLVQAVLAIADCYKLGIGYEKDVKKSMEYLKLAADKGYAEAQYRMGIYFQNAEDSSKDIIQAAYWYQKANSQGHVRATAKLDECIANMSLTQRLKWNLQKK